MTVTITADFYNEQTSNEEALDSIAKHLVESRAWRGPDRAVIELRGMVADITFDSVQSRACK